MAAGGDRRRGCSSRAADPLPGENGGTIAVDQWPGNVVLPPPATLPKFVQEIVYKGPQVFADGQQPKCHLSPIAWPANSGRQAGPEIR